MQSKLAAMRSGLFDLGITETPRLIMKHSITCAGVLLYFFAIDAIYSSLTCRILVSKFLPDLRSHRQAVQGPSFQSTPELVYSPEGHML
jgi:hypothetical protein